MTHLWGTKSRTGVDHCLEALLNHLGFYLPKLWPKSTQILKSTEICCCTCSHVKKITHVSPWRKVPSCLQKNPNLEGPPPESLQRIDRPPTSPTKKRDRSWLGHGCGKNLHNPRHEKHLRHHWKREPVIFWLGNLGKGKICVFLLGGWATLKSSSRAKKKAKGDAGQGPHLERSWCGVAIHFEDVRVLAKRTNAQTLISLIGGDIPV